jgi:hypothetical protein
MFEYGDFEVIFEKSYFIKESLMIRADKCKMQ